MSLGGYKFRGYTARRPDGMSNTDWYLLIHKTRVKAFLDASAAANAGWVIDYTDGQLDFESTTGAIYRLDDLGYNYVTAFRIPNEDAYFQIITFCKWSTNTSDPANGLINCRNILDYYYVNSSYGSYMTQLNKTTMFHRIGTYRKDPTNLSSKYGYTPLFQAGSVFSNTSNNYTVDADTDSRIFPNYNCGYGYAVKGKHIISIVKNGTFFSYSLLSADIYQSVFNSTDKFAKFNAIGFQDRGQTNQSATRDYGETDYNVGSATNYHTERYVASSSYSVNQAFIPLRTSNYTQATTIYPFSSVYTIMTEDSQDIQSNGIGSIPVDLLATNTTIGALFNRGSVVANGNYLCVSARSASSTYTIALSFTPVSGWGSSNYIGENIFVGWDSSNPDLNESSSWPVYNA